MKGLTFRDGIGGVRRTLSFNEDRIRLVQNKIEDWRCGVVSFKQVPQIPGQTETDQN
jgi:hypothetical protein